MSFFSEYKKCALCPRACLADRTAGQVGMCGSSDTALVARSALHFWEEPPVSGTKGSGAIFFSGCSLGCTFCQNYAISRAACGLKTSPDELCEAMLSLQAQGAHNINLVTAAHFVPTVVYALKKAKKSSLKIPVVYNSGGYESVQTLKKLRGLIDIYLPDMKYFSGEYSREYSAAEDYFSVCRAALAEMFFQTGRARFDENMIMQKGMIVRHLVIPGLVSDSKRVIEYLYKTYEDDIYISIMNQYTPPEKARGAHCPDRKLTVSEYDEVVAYARSLGVKNAFIQGEDTASESYIPDFCTDGLQNRL